MRLGLTLPREGAPFYVTFTSYISFSSIAFNIFPFPQLLHFLVYILTLLLIYISFSCLHFPSDVISFTATKSWVAKKQSLGSQPRSWRFPSTASHTLHHLPSFLCRKQFGSRNIIPFIFLLFFSFTCFLIVYSEAFVFCTNQQRAWTTTMFPFAANHLHNKRTLTPQPHSEAPPHTAPSRPALPPPAGLIYVFEFYFGCLSRVFWAFFGRFLGVFLGVFGRFWALFGLLFGRFLGV